MQFNNIIEYMNKAESNRNNAVIRALLNNSDIEGAEMQFDSVEEYLDKAECNRNNAIVNTLLSSEEPSEKGSSIVGKGQVGFMRVGFNIT